MSECSYLQPTRITRSIKLNSIQRIKRNGNYLFICAITVRVQYIHIFSCCYYILTLDLQRFVWYYDLVLQLKYKIRWKLKIVKIMFFDVQNNTFFCKMGKSTELNLFSDVYTIHAFQYSLLSSSNIQLTLYMYNAELEALPSEMEQCL